MAKPKLSWEQVKPLVPETSLYYVDYRDSFDHRLPQIETCIHESNYEALDDIIMDWDVEIDDEINEVRAAIEAKYPKLSSLSVHQIMDEYEDHIRDQIYDNDTSTPLDDLMRNTSKQAMFYDTGYEMASGSWQWSEKEVIQERNRIKAHLSLRNVTEHINDAIDMMVMQASYGGTLVIYFYQNPCDFILTDPKFKSIRFKNFALAIIDTVNGTGDHCYCMNCNIRLPFEKERLHICANIKYSYTHNVCGMISNWADQTQLSFETKRSQKVLPESHLSEIKSRDLRYDTTFRAGKCTPGDMDYNRHRNKTYINTYPCGNKCLDCGTFWLD